MEEINNSEQVQTELDEVQNSSLAETNDNHTDSNTTTKSETKFSNEDSKNIDSNADMPDVSDKNKALESNNFQEQKILKEVLEKLNIQEQRQPQEKFFKDILAQETIKNEMEIKSKNTQLRQVVSGDLAKIQMFIQQGVINPLQGQNLKNLVLKNAFDKYIQYSGIKAQNNDKQPAQYQNVSNATQNDTKEIPKAQPEFFNKEGRKEVTEYLKSSGVNFGADELNKISTIVESIEKNAIDRYLKKTAYEKNLRKSNESAKQKLTATAQNGSFSNGAVRTFTRKQIGKMSSAEFVKNESQIMEQLRKGLIK